MSKEQGHHQSKGQWLINRIRLGIEKKLNASRMNHEYIEQRIWNMTNEEFDKIMEKYHQ